MSLVQDRSRVLAQELRSFQFSAGEQRVTKCLQDLYTNTIRYHNNPAYFVQTFIKVVCINQLTNIHQGNCKRSGTK